MARPDFQIPISQVAMVVRDLEKSIREYTETMGWVFGRSTTESRRVFMTPLCGVLHRNSPG
jgi:hypothetical protein